MRQKAGMGKGQRGSTLVEFAIGALVFFTAVFGVLEFSRLLWTHNALNDAARRGARYAVTHGEADANAVKNVAVYGNAEGEGQPLVAGLSPEMVDVDYKDSSIPGVGFGYPDGSVTVSVTGFEYKIVLPFLGSGVTLPDYRTTLTAESAGVIPDNIGASPTPTPTPEPSPTPGPTATPTPDPTPDPTATPTPSPTPTPTPPACKRGDKPSETGCYCEPPMTVHNNGKCQ
jgi:hypothetical protein